MSDTDRKDLPPTDPWVSWRKPTATSAVDAGKTEKIAESAPVADEQPAAEAQRPSGTLSPRKADKSESRPDRPRVRGGSKPYEKKAPRPALRDGASAGKPGERQEAKPWQKKPAGDARPAGKPHARKDEVGRENSWGRKASVSTSGSDARAAGKPYGKAALASPENPWAKALSRREDAPAKIAPQQPSTAKPAGEAPSGVRLSKVMSERGLCSRREADLWIERGWVFVNGEQISELGSRIAPDAEISVSKEAVRDQAKAVTILLHKPVGYVSGQPEPDCIPAVTLIGLDNQVVQSGDPEFKPWMLRGLAPAGRLDVDSTGLLVLTSDGRVAKRLIGENSDAEKEYLVRVSGEMIKGGLELLRHGLELDGKPLKPAWVKQLNEDQLHFILKEGKKRQIRRMCELVGLRVIGLKRVRIGRIRLGDLPLGQWRFLRADEAF